MRRWGRRLGACLLHGRRLCRGYRAAAHGGWWPTSLGRCGFWHRLPSVCLLGVVILVLFPVLVHGQSLSCRCAGRGRCRKVVRRRIWKRVRLRSGDSGGGGSSSCHRKCTGRAGRPRSTTRIGGPRGRGCSTLWRGRRRVLRLPQDNPCSGMTVLSILPRRLGQLSQGSHAPQNASLRKSSLFRACLVLQRGFQPVPQGLLLVCHRSLVVVRPPVLVDTAVAVAMSMPVHSFILLGRGLLLRRA